MPNARVKPGETPDQARVRYNAEQRAYRLRRKQEGRPLAERSQQEVFAHGLWKKYRLRVEDYAALRASQKHACAICGLVFAPENRAGSHPDNCVVDHCHASGKVRGLLCPHCNLGLGHFRDNPALLTKAATYLLP